MRLSTFNKIGLTGLFCAVAMAAKAGPNNPATQGYVDNKFQSAIAVSQDYTNTQVSTIIKNLPVGPQGATGATGATGAQGSKGNTGATGAIGPKGATGTTGSPGPAGAVGPQGIKGDAGDIGPTGPAGATGATGATGLQGSKGDTGAAGAIGPKGATGATGVAGPTGSTGSVGAVGPQGAKGDTGDIGPTGIAGPAGATGATGLQGSKGDAGAMGPMGSTGATGSTGARGTTGATGSTGAGVPSGGSAGQLLVKNSNADFDTTWVDPAAQTTYKIGERHQGGTIFWLDKTEKHGLIAALVDQNDGSPVTWNNKTSRVTNASGSGLYAGASNTDLIISSQTPDNTGGTFAALVCHQYAIQNNGSEPCAPLNKNSATDTCYANWYLPSAYELILLRDSTANQKPSDGYKALDGDYWSSTENDEATAWTINSKDTQTATKDETKIVRCVRSF